MTFLLLSSDLRLLKLNQQLGTRASNSWLSIAGGTNIRHSSSMNELTPLSFSQSMQVLDYTPDQTGPQVLSRGFALFDLNSGNFSINFDEPVDVSTINTPVNLFQHQANAVLGSDVFTVNNLDCSPPLCQDNENITFSLPREELNRVKLNNRICFSASTCWLTIPTADFIRDMAGNLIVTLPNGNPVYPRILVTFIDDSEGPYLENYVLNLTSRELVLNFDEPIEASSFNVSGISLLSFPGATDSTLVYRLTGGTLTPPTNGAVVTVALSDDDVNAIESRPNLASAMSNTYLSLESGVVIDLSSGQNMLQAIPDTNARLAANFVPDQAPPQIQSFDLDLDRNIMTVRFSDPVRIPSLSLDRLIVASSQLGTNTYNITGGTLINTTAEASSEIMFTLTNEDVVYLKVSSAIATSSSNTFIASQDGVATDTNFLTSLALPVSDAIRVNNLILDQSHPNIVGFSLDMNIGQAVITFDDAVLGSSFAVSGITFQSSTSRIPMEWHTLSPTSSSNSMDTGFSVTVNIGLDDLNRLKQIRNLTTNVANTFLTATASSIDDVSGTDVIAITDGNAIPVTEFVPDISRPRFESWTLDLNLGQIILTFSETVDITTIQPSAITLISGRSSSVMYSLTGYASLIPPDADYRVAIQLSRVDSNAIKLMTNLATDYFNSYIYFTSDAIQDMNMNDVIAITRPNAVMVALYIPDITSPLLESFDLNINTGLISLTFDETVDASSLSIPAFTLVNRASRPDAEYTLSDSLSSSSNGPVITIQLSSNDLNALKAISGLATSSSDSFLTALSSGITDMNGTSLRQITSDSALQVTLGGYTGDSVSPTLEYFTLNVSSEQLIFTFSETVSTSVDPTQIVLQSRISSSVVGINTLSLTGGTISRTVGPVIVLQLVEDDANRLKGIRNLGTATDNTFISIMEGAFQDEASNLVTPILPTNALQAQLVVPDTIAPVLSQFSLDLYSQVLLLVFDETVDSGTFTATSVTLQDAATNPTQSVSLETFSRTDSPDGTNLIVQLSSEDFNAIVATFPLATMNTNTFIALASGAVGDVAGIPSAAIPTTNALPITDHTADQVRPSLTDFSLDLDNGVLTLTFNESVNVTSVDTTQMSLQNAPLNATQTFALTGGLVNQRDSTTIDVTLLSNDFNKIKQITDLATVRGDTYLSITAATVLDMNKNPVVAISMNNALLSRTVQPDTSSPRILGFDFNYNTGEMTIFFDETVNLAVFQPNAISFQTASIHPYVAHMLQNATIISTGLQPAVMLRVSQSDLNDLKRLRVCTNMDVCFMSVTSNLVRDVSGVPNADILPSAATAVGTYNLDQTRPELLEYSIFDLNEGSFTLQFSETVDVGTLNDTQITLDNGYINASVVFSLSQLLPRGNDSDLLTFEINPTNLNELKLLTNLCTYEGNCWIRFSERFIQDVSGNLIVPVLPNTINTFHRPQQFIPDTTPPILRYFDMDLNTGRMSFTFNEVIRLGTFHPMNLTFQDASIPERSTNLRDYGHSSRSADGLVIYWNMTVADLNLLKSHEYLFSSQSNSYLTHSSFVEDISGTSSGIRDMALQASTYIPDTTRPILQYFRAFNFNNGTFTLQFDEPINISSVNLVNGVTIAKNLSLDLSIYDREYINDWYSVLFENGTLYNLTHTFSRGEYVLDCPFSLVPIQNSDMAMTVSPVVTSTVNSTDNSGSGSGSSGSGSSGSGETPNMAEPPTLQELVNVDFYPLSLRGCEIYRNLTVNEPFHILTGGEASYVDERKQQVLVTLNRPDLRIFKLNSLLASDDANTWVAFNETDLKDFANNNVIPSSLFNATKLQNGRFVEDITPPTFEFAVLDMDSSVLSLNFNDIMDAQSINPLLIEISEYPDSNNSYVLQGPYPYPKPLSVDLRDNYTINIPLSFDDMNVLKNNFDLATSEMNTYISFPSEIASDIYGLYPELVDYAQVVQLIPDETGPQLLSFTIDYEEHILNLTFDEVVNPLAGNHRGIIVQNVANRSDIEEGRFLRTHTFVEGGMPIENSTGVSTLQLSLDLDLNALIITSDLGSTVNNTYLVLENGTFYDQKNNTNQIIAINEALQATAIVEDNSPPTLEYFDLNLNDNYLLLKFSEAVLLETFNASAITLLSSPRSQQRVTFDQNSRLTAEGFNSIISVHFTIQNEEELKNPSNTLAESSETTYISIERELSENYAGFRVVRISESNASPVRNYFEGKYILMEVWILLVLCKPVRQNLFVIIFIQRVNALFILKSMK